MEALIFFYTSQMSPVLEKRMETNQRVLTVLVVFLAIVGAVIMYQFLLRVLSGLLPVRSARVEIMHLNNGEENPDRNQPKQKARTEENAGKNRQLVTVRFLERKVCRVRMMKMCDEGLKIGDIGILQYQGMIGKSFMKEGSSVGEKQSIYYDFGFEQDKKQKAADVKQVRKREYW